MAASRLGVKENLSHKSSPEKWSPKEILGHLIDSAYNHHQRFLRANTQENLVFQGYEQAFWVVANRYQARPSNEIIDFWYQANLLSPH